MSTEIQYPAYRGTTSGANTGDVTLGAVGSSPNASGASLSGQVLTLQPASATQPGAVTAGAQTLAGAKTFSGAVTCSSTLSANSTFTADGAGISSSLPVYNPSSALTVKGGFFTAGASSANLVVDGFTALSVAGGKLAVFKDNGTEHASIDKSGKYQTDFTDSSASPGSATANTPSGRAAIAASGTAATITSSCCNANSVVMVQLEDNDTTATKVKVVPAAGSFVVTANAAATATTKFRWIIFN